MISQLPAGQHRLCDFRQVHHPVLGSLIDLPRRSYMGHVGHTMPCHHLVQDPSSNKTLNLDASQSLQDQIRLKYESNLTIMPHRAAIRHNFGFNKQSVESLILSRMEML